MNKKKLLVSAALMLFALPVLAVFNEKDLPQTLSVLRFELKQEVAKMEARSTSIRSRERAQHIGMIQLTKRCNELALMLYSQSNDFTMDMTYALQEVTKEYESFHMRRMPFDEIIGSLDQEIDRYSRLVESLRRIPPQLKDIDEIPDSLKYHNDSLKFVNRVPRHMPRHTLEGRTMVLDSLNSRGHKMVFFLDEQGQADRDSCIHYASTLLKMYSMAKDRIVADNEHYEETSMRLKESYDYAHDRYNKLQKSMLTHGQGSFFRVLKRLKAYINFAKDDAARKYSSRSVVDGSLSRSEWRGPQVTGLVFAVLLCLLVSTVISILLVTLLGRFIKLFREEGFQKRKLGITIACGVLIFAAAVLIATPMVDNNFLKLASGLLTKLSIVLLLTLIAILFRVDMHKCSAAVRLCLPVFLMGILLVSFRIMFLPNRMLALILPPLMLAGFIWQAICSGRLRKRTERIDRILGRISLFVLLAGTVLSWLGYNFICIIVIVWWLFQMMSVQVIVTLVNILDRYGDGRMQRRIDRMAAEMPSLTDVSDRGDYISITWVYDMVRMALIPILAIMSISFCLRNAMEIFDMRELCNTLFSTPFFNLADKSGAMILHVSMHKIVVVATLYFVFRYINYFLRSFYRVLKLEKMRRDSGRVHIHANEFNLTLANNVIAIIVWGVYIVTVILLWKIPVGALSIVAAGLATGIGLAMKDILNNFIYGIQLMSGRLRVGDWIVCEGVRGRVSGISYQSTQIECEDGSVMSFLNATLFNNNFRNLTRNNSYELVKIICGVSYGTDVERVRTLLLEALKAEQKKDAFGRDIVNPEKGVTVAVDELAESSVNIAIKQHVLVTERWGYIARVKELVYNTLNANGITIPFNQLDVHVVSE